MSKVSQHFASISKITLLKRRFKGTETMLVRFWQNKDRSLDIFGHLCNEESVNFLIYAKKIWNKEYKKVITLHSSALHNSEECIIKETNRMLYKEGILSNQIDTQLIISKRENNNEIDFGED